MCLCLAGCVRCFKWCGIGQALRWYCIAAEGGGSHNHIAVTLQLHPIGGHGSNTKRLCGFAG
jgi:hypothetical protein